ncbi:hypothetical protein [Saccharothrix syringae]|uniref:SHOCT domain-containing protein n=1 Tax=Saccharothrix syringae TaxID=103733 RepID=A0A5Q0GQ84_SACSY|nr:hypothetical protein [Saccharothrix syringae]QFZ16108.1 hypothetical protein EKG83_00305 [Saccharothrix syringae]
MSWQDELRELDTALAEGRISADEYRQQRDNVLSTAAPQVPQVQPQFPPPAQQGSPFAPPLRWEAVNPNAQQQPPPNTDATQVVSNPSVGQQVPNQDATQVVNARQAGGNPDSERTQYVRPVAPPPPPPWQGGGAPPWGSTDFAGEQNPSWIAQGPEVFEDKPSGAGKRVLAILVVVVVLAGIGFGVWYFTRGGGEDPNANGGTGGTSTAASTTTTTEKPKPTDPFEILLEQVPEPGGKDNQRAEVLDMSEVVTEQVMEQGEADLLAAGGATKVAWKAGNKQADEFGPTPDRFSIVVVPMADEAAAQKAVQDLKLYQETRGGLVFIKDPLPDMPPQLVFEKKVEPDLALYRGIWASGKNLVRVNVDQYPMTGEAGLSGSYQRQVHLVLKTFPAA